MDWRPPADPDDLPAGDDNKGWRKVSRTSRFKRQEKHGAFGGVHVIDVAAASSTKPAQGNDHASTRTSPATHLRRGHWRSVRVVERDAAGNRVGTRDGVEGTDWHYEGRWISPSVVNAGGHNASSLPVYRLPSRNG